MSMFLLALAWPNHVHHEAAHQWFTVVWLSAHPAVVKVTLAVSDAIRILEANTSAAEHKFWPLEHGITQILPEILERLMGHHQVQDALLLDLAIRRGGKLATFDRHIGNLLALESRHRSALEILPAE